MPYVNNNTRIDWMLAGIPRDTVRVVIPVTVNIRRNYKQKSGKSGHLSHLCKIKNSSCEKWIGDKSIQIMIQFEIQSLLFHMNILLNYYNKIETFYQNLDQLVTKRLYFSQFSELNEATSWCILTVQVSVHVLKWLL